MHTTVLSVHVGKPQSRSRIDRKTGEERSFTTSIFKSEVKGVIRATKQGLDGDQQHELRFHGGPDRALLILDVRHLASFEPLVGREIPHGAFGENATVGEFDERQVCIGDTWQLGDAIIEISQPRLPCANIAHRLECDEIVSAVLDARKGGVYARVLQEGDFEAGSDLVRLTNPFADWTIARATEIYLSKNPEKQKLLAALAPLSELWRTRLQ